MHTVSSKNKYYFILDLIIYVAKPSNILLANTFEFYNNAALPDGLIIYGSNNN